MRSLRHRVRHDTVNTHGGQSSLLFNVKTTDPATFALVSVILLAVALVASFVPAYRATTVDPLNALRQE